MASQAGISIRRVAACCPRLVGPDRRPAYRVTVLCSGYHDIAQNRIWLAIAALARDLLARTARLALPAHAATCEPKRLRLRILAVADRVVRTARRRLLKIGQPGPGPQVITTAHARLIALPAP